MVIGVDDDVTLNEIDFQNQLISHRNLWLL